MRAKAGTLRDGGVGADGGAAAHQRRAVLVFARHGGAWVVDVGQYHARAAEDVVFQGDVIVDGDVILHLDVVADDHTVAHEAVLAERAVFANTGTAADVDPVPDPAAGANGGAVINDGGLMDLVVEHCGS
jgi:hypothetical protein